MNEKQAGAERASSAYTGTEAIEGLSLVACSLQFGQPAFLWNQGPPA